MNPPTTVAITAESPDHLPGRFQLYVDALEEAGGKAVFVFPEEDAKDLVMKYDGFLIPGGGDIDPSYYGEERVFPCVAEDSSRTDFEISLLGEIMPLQKPVLGICYGMQLINVFFRGSLYQDISLQEEGALDHREGVHPITMTDNPFLSEGHMEVNSSHHQAVKRVGRGIRAFASAPDGIIEAFYREQYPFLLGVQWHPERMDTQLSTLIFKRFVGACHADK
jgi:putative glutamine amidotransferase